MARRIADANKARGPVRDIVRPVGMPPVDVDALVARCLDAWADVCPAAEIAPFAARFEAVPAERRQHLADIACIQSLRQDEHPSTLFDDAARAFRSFPDAGDLATLLVVHDSSRVHHVAFGALAQQHYAAAQPVLRELLFAPPRVGYQPARVRMYAPYTELPDVLAAIGAIDDALVERALDVASSASSCSAQLLMRVVGLSAVASERVLQRLIDSVEAPGYAAALREAVARRGVRIASLIPRLEAMLRERRGDAAAAADMLASWGEASGTRFLEQLSREAERNDPYR